MEHLADLAAWMDTEGLGSGPIDDVAPLAGGSQNLILCFRREDPATFYILRRPAPGAAATVNETMRREARLLGALAGTGVPHPGLIAACGDESVIGVAFYLMEPVDGVNPMNGLPPLHAGSAAARHATGLSVIDGIVALGALDHRALGLADFGRPEKYLERQVGRWAGQLAGYKDMSGWPGPDGLPGIVAVGRWLEAHCPAAFVPGILHGDYHLANVMIRRDAPDLAAIIDWELATIGDPLIDLGWLLATWPAPDGTGGTVTVTPWAGFPTADELVAHYAAGSRRDVAAIGWYKVLACYKLAILLEGTFARACAGRAPRDVGDRLHGRAVALMGRALEWIA